jgi:hypothetical protein
LAYRLTRDLRRVVFPTPGGPTIVTSRGGGSSGIRSTWGTCSRFSLIYRDQQDLKREFSILTSCDRAADFANRPGFAKLKAFGLRSAEVSERKGTGSGLAYLRYASSSSSPSKADAAYSIDPPSCVDTAVIISSS